MYRVIWIQEALDDLASLWVAADSQTRKAVTEGVRQLDQLLEDKP